MENQIKKFLEFNNNTIYFNDVNGVWWIAIKPICEALNVDYIQQFKNTKEHLILGQLLCKHTMVAKDGKFRKMVCLPEYNVYGWLFGIQSDSLGLIQFQWECFDILFNHFHGTITGRKELLTKKAKAEARKKVLMKSLTTTADYLELNEVTKEISLTTKALNQHDRDYIAGQKDFFSEEKEN